MKKFRAASKLLAAAALLSTPLPILAEEPDETAQIIDEGLSRSQVQQTAHGSGHASPIRPICGRQKLGR